MVPLSEEPGCNMQSVRSDVLILMPERGRLLLEKAISGSKSMNFVLGSVFPHHISSESAHSPAGISIVQGLG